MKREIPVQDDPYWKVSNIYMDAHRVGRFISKFERFEEEYPEWTDELIGGVPTFYCVLGVARGATEEEIQKAFEKKLNFSSYSRDIIEKAFEVLSDPDLQKEYDELLFIFEQTTKCIPPGEKNELIKNHDNHIRQEKEAVRMGEILPLYTGFMDLYIHGMPDLYEIIGLSKNSSFEEIKKQCETGSELFKKIYTILGDPVRRADYDFLMYYTMKYGDKRQLEKRNNRRKRWDDMDRNLLEKIALTVLDDPNGIEKSKERMSSIFSRNQDWKQYLPPNKDTFFSILGLDSGALSCDKKECEKVIREKYRYLEKTPQVNLAYSVLKNASQRDDYLWLMENIELSNAYEKIFSEDKSDDPSQKMMQKGRTEESTQHKIPHTQMTFEDILQEIMERRS